MFATRDYQAAIRAATEAEAVGGTISEEAARRARVWVWAGRSWTDPSFSVEELRPQIEAAIQTSRDADDIDGVLDGLQGLVLVDLNVAHWADVVTSARRGLEVAIAHGREGRRGDFARWLANALLWGIMPATEAIREIEALLAAETRRWQRAAMLASLSVLHGIVGDRSKADAAEAESSAIIAELGDRPNTFRHAFKEFALDDLRAGIAGAQAEEAELAKLGETGQRSTMVGLQAYMHALLGENTMALRRAEDSRQIGASDDAVTQLLWRVAAALAHAQLGHLDEAERLSAEALEVANETDSLNAADAYEVRARVLELLGRRDEMLDAATRARELHAAKGSVNFLRRLDAFLAELGVEIAELESASRA